MSGLQSIINKCRICGTEGETIEHIISSCTVLVQSEYKKRHDIFAKIIHKNLAVKGPVHLAFCLQDLLAHASM
jgi:hypothetical protein